MEDRLAKLQEENDRLKKAWSDVLVTYQKFSYLLFTSVSNSPSSDILNEIANNYKQIEDIVPFPKEKKQIHF